MRINPKIIINKKTYLSAYWVRGRRKYLNAENIIAALKFATTALNYMSLKVIPIYIVDTHLLRSGGSNALSPAGYSDINIQKWGYLEGKILRKT